MLNPSLKKELHGWFWFFFSVVLVLTILALLYVAIPLSILWVMGFHVSFRNWLILYLIIMVSQGTFHKFSRG